MCVGISRIQYRNVRFYRAKTPVQSIIIGRFYGYIIIEPITHQIGYLYYYVRVYVHTPYCHRIRNYTVLYATSNHGLGT